LNLAIYIILLPQVQSAAGQRVWHQTVDALPSSWFAAEHSAVLVSYCNHVIRAAQIEAALATLETLTELNQFDKLSKLAAGESAKIAMHALAMRLTQQSRLKAETASSSGLGAASAASASKKSREGAGVSKYYDLIMR
jgi:hypothetical protein